MEFHGAAPILGGIAIISGALTIAAHYALTRRQWLFVVLKALTTTLILLTAVLGAIPGWGLYASAIVLGVLFCLLGDIMLALPRERFLAGLASFMIANLIYAFAFVANSRLGASAWPAIPLAAYAAFMLWYLWPALSVEMRVPVGAYLLVMVVMVGLAIYGAVSQTSFGARAAAAGALLYLVSDSVLAISRFRHPFRLSRAFVLGTYFVGQILVAISAGS